MTKRILLVAGIIGILLVSSLAFTGCDLNNEGTIVVRNASTYSGDSNVFVRIRDSSFNTVDTSYVSRNNTVSFTLPVGSYDIQVVDGLNITWTSAGWISLAKNETRRYKFTGTSVIAD